MFTDDFYENLVTEQNYFHQAIVSETKPNEQKIEKADGNHPIASEVSIGVVLFSGLIFFLMLSKRATAMQENMEYTSDSSKKNSQFPCPNCRFFSNNPYLKCAARPTDVLTKKAIDCSDYRPRNNRCSR